MSRFESVGNKYGIHILFSSVILFGIGNLILIFTEYYISKWIFFFLMPGSRSIEVQVIFSSLLYLFFNLIIALIGSLILSRIVRDWKYFEILYIIFGSVMIIMGFYIFYINNYVASLFHWTLSDPLNGVTVLYFTIGIILVSGISVRHKVKSDREKDLELIQMQEKQTKDESEE